MVTRSSASACNTDTTPTQPHRISNTHRTKNKTTNVIIQQNSRKLLMMDILSETCWAHKKWNKIASDIKLVFYSSTVVTLVTEVVIHVKCLFGWSDFDHTWILLTVLYQISWRCVQREDGPGIVFWWGRDFPPVQTGPGAHPASYTMGTRSFRGVKCGRGVLLTTHPLLVPRSWKRGAIPLPTLWATPGL